MECSGGKPGRRRMPYQRLLNCYQRAANGAGYPVPQAGEAGAQNGSERVGWWRRLFG